MAPPDTAEAVLSVLRWEGREEDSGEGIWPLWPSGARRPGLGDRGADPGGDSRALLDERRWRPRKGDREGLSRDGGGGRGSDCDAGDGVRVPDDWPSAEGTAGAPVDVAGAAGVAFSFLWRRKRDNLSMVV